MISTEQEFNMKVSSGVVFVFFVVGLAIAVPSEEKPEPENVNTVFGTEKCSEVKGLDNTVTCIAMTSLKRLEDLSAKENIEIMPGVILTSEISKTERESRHKRTMSVPKSVEDRISTIFDMMFNVMDNLFNARTLKIKMTENNTNSVMRAFEDGRGKMKKLAGPLMMALGAKMIAVIPIMLGGLALFASKAMIVSKLALVLALILGAQYMFNSGGPGIFNRFGGQGLWGNYGGFFGGNHGGGHNYVQYGAPAWQSSWNTGNTQSYPYSRSLNKAQDLAYSAHKE